MSPSPLTFHLPHDAQGGFMLHEIRKFAASGAPRQTRRGWAGHAALLLLGVAALLGFSPAARAQLTSGTIYGSVQDASGAMISNAEVTATEPDKGVTRTTTSSGSGTFALPNLPPGNYTVQVGAPGFETYKKSGVLLSAADSLNAGIFTLKIGAETTSVEVVANTAQLQVQTDSGERSDQITSKQLDDVAM